MEFLRAKRRKVDVPILPMIDILTILLIYLFVTTTRKEPRPVMNVEVPVASGSVTSSTVERRSVLAVSAAGDITLEAVRVLPGDLVGYLKAWRSVNPDRKLELKIDQACPFGTMVQVWEALTECGISLNEIPHRVKSPKTVETSANP